MEVLIFFEIKNVHQNFNLIMTSHHQQCEIKERIDLLKQTECERFCYNSKLGIFFDVGRHLMATILK